MELGRSINIVRLSKNVSQDILAQKAEISVGYLSMIENGVRIPSIAVLQDICDGLGVEMWQVLFLTEVEQKLSSNARRNYVLDRIAQLFVFLEQAEQVETRLARTNIPYRIEFER